MPRKKLIPTLGDLEANINAVNDATKDMITVYDNPEQISDPVTSSEPDPAPKPEPESDQEAAKDQITDTIKVDTKPETEQTADTYSIDRGNMVGIPVKLSPALNLAFTRTINRNQTTAYALLREVLDYQMSHEDNEELILNYMQVQRRAERRTILCPVEFRDKIYEQAANLGMNKTGFIAYAIEVYLTSIGAM